MLRSFYLLVMTSNCGKKECASQRTFREWRRRNETHLAKVLGRHGPDGTQALGNGGER